MSRTPREQYFEAPAGRLCWFEWGSVVSRRASLLLLHATGFHARLWDQVIAYLPADTHVIAPDLRGHGRSFRPHSLGCWEANVDDVAALLDSLAGRDLGSLTGRALVGVGHSMGGYCLARLAGQSPQFFEQLLLVDPTIMDPALYAASVTSASDVAASTTADHPIARRRNRWESAAQMIAHFQDRKPYATWSPAVLADYCTYGLVPAADGEWLELACPPPLEASVYQGALRCDPHPHLASLSCPVTVLRAKQASRKDALDFSSSPTWPELASAFAYGRDMQWSDCSHFIPMDTPERLAAQIIQAMTTEATRAK